MVFLDTQLIHPLSCLPCSPVVGVSVSRIPQPFWGRPEACAEANRLVELLTDAPLAVVRQLDVVAVQKVAVLLLCLVSALLSGVGEEEYGFVLILESEDHR